MPGLRDVGQATIARRETSIGTMTTARLFSALAAVQCLSLAR